LEKEQQQWFDHRIQYLRRAFCCRGGGGVDGGGGDACGASRICPRPPVRTIGDACDAIHGHR